MLMQKHSPNSNVKIVENDDVNSNSSHSNGNFFPGRNASLAGSECNDDKSNDPCSSGDESHEQDNAEQENQTSFIDSSNRDQFKLSAKKKKKKTVKVKFSGSQDDKAGIKLKIRRTNNFNQDENHVIVDPADQQRKRHLKTKRNKNDSQDISLYKSKCSQLEEVSNTVTSDDSLPQKRSRADSEEEMISKVSVGVNTLSKGTEIDESVLGPCQAGSKLTLESVVLMETQSGILIVSVQWRGKTLMGALMESERFQIGTLEKDTIYRRDKFMGMNRRNTRRKSKNLFGKKKRKTATPPDPNDVGGTENEAGNSDVDNPYMCDKEDCHMKFSDFQALRIHIYQNHRAKDGLCVKEEPNVKIEASMVIKSEPTVMGNVYVTPESLFPMLKHLRTNDCNSKPPNSEMLRSDQLPLGVRNRPSPLPEVISSSNNATNQPSEERNSFSPAYSDISDANEAPVLENEAELKPPSSASQPPLNLSLCHNPSLHAANRLFSPTAPALQPEGLCSGPPLSNLRLSHDTKLPSLANYRYPITSNKFDQHQEPTSIFSNGYLHNLSNNNHKTQNGVLSLHSSSGPPLSENHGVNSIQDLSMNSPLNLLSSNTNNNNNTSSNKNNNNNHHHLNKYHHQSNHKTAPPPPPTNIITKPTTATTTNLHQPSRHHHPPLHSHHHHSITNGLVSNNQINSKHSSSSVSSSVSSVSSSLNNQSDNNTSSNQQTPPNGVGLSHLPFMSFVTSVNSPTSKLNYPMSLFHQPKF